MASPVPTASHEALIRSLTARRIIRSKRIADVMRAVDRGRYVHINPYIDTPQMLGFSATISAPHMHAMALQLLDKWLVPGAQALDVGCGSGYLVACMARLVQGDEDVQGKVIGVEHVQGLCDLSKQNLESDVPHLMKKNIIEIRTADGRNGIDGKEFDAIHVGAASLGMPQGLVASLRRGGRMVVPIEDRLGIQTLTCVDKLQDGSLSTTTVTGVRYVPLCDLSDQLRDSD